MRARQLVPALLMVLTTMPSHPVAGAQQPATVARHERPVYPAAEGPNRLSLDATVLAGSRPFRVDRVNASQGSIAVATGGAGDLRLYNSSGSEVPYLLVTPQVEARWREGRLLRIASTKETSGFEVDFEDAFPIDRVSIDGLPAPFLKRLRLEGSGDRRHWTVLAADATIFDLPREGLEHTSLDFEAGSYRYLRVTWDDRSSSRLPRPRSVAVRIASPTEGPAPLRAAVEFQRRASEPGKSRFRIRLPGAHLPIVALELEVASGNVMRTVRVTEGRLEGGQVVPSELGTATLRRAVRDGLAASQLRIPITPPTEAQLELVVDDGNNPPLDVTGVTAVFALLPFIYFESSRVDTLAARYGDEHVLTPSYDLEAERDRISSLSVPEAHWGAPREAPQPTTAATGVLPIEGGEIEVERFRYSRPIPLGGPGLTTLQLDAAALAHGSLSDLRLATPDGHQVPFLIERLDEPLALTLPALQPMKTSRDPTAARSRYRVQLPYAGLPPSRLVLRTDARVFDRQVTLEVEPSPTASDTRPRGVGRNGPLLIARATWVNRDLETPAAPLTLAVPAVASNQLVLTVDEGDNAALPLREATLLLPSYRLRFFRDGRTPLNLVYGRRDLAAPRYDLALVAPRLLGAPAEEVLAGPEAALEGVTGITPSIVFWSALGAAVVALLALIVRLLRPAASAAAAAPTVSTPPTSAASGGGE